MNNTVMKRAEAPEGDYRIIYRSMEEFDWRIQDVYIGKNTNRRPPFFHDILQELMDIQAILFLDELIAEKRKEDSDREELKRLEQLQNDILTEAHEHAIDEALILAGEDYLALFARDVYIYLMVNHYSFIEQDSYNRHIWEVKNQPISHVW